MSGRLRPLVRQVSLPLALAMVLVSCGTRLDDRERLASGLQQGTSGPTARSEAREEADGVNDLSTDAARSAASDLDGVEATAEGESQPRGRSASAAGAAQPAASSPGRSDPGVTDSEIRVGCSATLSGFLGFFGEQQVGPVDSWFQHVNSQGGINGRKLRLICYDDGGDTSRRLANVRRLYEQDKVIALLPGFSTGLEDYVTRNNLPSLEIGASPAAYRSKYPSILPIAEHPFEFTGQLTEALKIAGVFKPGMRVAMLYDPEYFKYLEVFRKQWEWAGAEVVSEDPIGLTDDCTPLVLKMRQLDIDYWDFEGAGWIQCLSASQRQNYKPNIGWGNWPASLRLLIEQAGPYTEGMWSGTFADQIDGKPRVKTAEHEQMLSLIKRYHPKIAEPGNIDSPVTQSHWIIAKMLTRAFDAQGDVITKQGTLEWLWSLENYDTGIATPIIALSPNCKAGTGTSWFGRWHWEGNVAQIVPATGYLHNPFADRLGGKCHMTTVVDEQEAG